MLQVAIEQIHMPSQCNIYIIWKFCDMHEVHRFFKARQIDQQFTLPSSLYYAALYRYLYRSIAAAVNTYQSVRTT